MQQPRLRQVPPHLSSAGAEAVDLAAHAGLQLDPWEQLVLDDMLVEDADGDWAAFEYGLIVPRQNGKGAILEARELAGLFLFGEGLIVHSAHEFKTAQEAFRRVLSLIESTPDLDRRVKKVSRSHGDEGIELKTGQRLRFLARTGGSGRGFSGDVVILDEAFDLPSAAHGALLPIMSARPNPQLIYASSSVDQKVHANGVVLARVRERAMDGQDPSLGFAEWSVDDQEFWADPDAVAGDGRTTDPDPAAVAQANPGLGFRLTLEHTARERRAMDLGTFAVERLGVGDWPDTTASAEHVIDLETWADRADPDSTLGTEDDPGVVAFGLDVNPDRSYAAIGAAGRRADGRIHVEVTDHRAGTRWVVARAKALRDRWGPCAFVVDAAGPAASLIPDLKAAGFDVKDSDGEGLLVTMSAREMGQACGDFYDRATATGELVHLSDSVLNNALAAAKTRPLGDAWAWARKGTTDISPLVAVTLAAHGVVVHGGDSAPEPFFVM